MDYNNYQNGYQQPWGNQPYAEKCMCGWHWHSLSLA